MNCKETSWLLSMSREKPLTWSERLAVRVHLWICAQCRRFERQLRWLDRLAGKGNTEPPEWVAADLSLSQAARARIRGAIEARRAGGD